MYNPIIISKLAHGLMLDSWTDVHKTNRVRIVYCLQLYIQINVNVVVLAAVATVIFFVENTIN